MADKTRPEGVHRNRPRGVPARGPGHYRLAAKPAGDFVCEDCGIVQHGGMWHAGPLPTVCHQSGLCPACRRIRENYPAGTIRIPRSLLSGSEHLIHLIRNVEAAERAEHPLERLMDIEHSDEHMVVRTTGVHLARALAHSLSKQFHRKPHLRFADGEELVYVDWDDDGAQETPAS